MRKLMAVILSCATLLGATACATKPKMEELSAADTWIVAYTRIPNEAYSAFLGQSVHFAVTTDSGKTFEPLYHNYGKLFAKCDFNEENGIVSNGLHNIEIYRIVDEYIITAAETQRTKLADGNYPERDTGDYVRWSTKDFITFTELETTDSRLKMGENMKCDDASISISAPELAHTENAAAITISKEIADTLIANNVTVEFESFELPKSVTVSSREELDAITATVTYTDGSTHEKHVKWDADKIDFTKPGKYTIDGEVVIRRFQYPVEEHPWGDPIVTYYNNKYYYIATNDADGDTSFEVREADTPEALFEPGVKRGVILDKNHDLFQNTYWAPEFHMIGGKLRILCALTIEGFDPQCYIMTLADGGDPTKREDWSAPIRMVMPDERYLGTNPLGDGKNGITLDMTHFVAGDKDYVAWSFRTWAGTDSGSMIMIAQLDPENPRKLLTFPQLLTRPYYGWEHNTGTDNNEGPHPIVRDGKVYLAFSGGDARGQMYAIGMLVGDVNDDLCDVNNWVNLHAPVLASEFVEGQYGPGHNGFFIDEYGDTYITYHSVRGSHDRGIVPGIRRVHFLKDGMPYLAMTDAQDFPVGEENVKITVIVE